MLLGLTPKHTSHSMGTQHPSQKIISNKAFATQFLRDSIYPAQPAASTQPSIRSLTPTRKKPSPHVITALSSYSTRKNLNHFVSTNMDRQLPRPRPLTIDDERNPSKEVRIELSTLKRPNSRNYRQRLKEENGIHIRRETR